jgi:DNA recombination-dependent growth factor C
MGLLSSSVSLTRYKVEGKLKNPVLDTVANGLKKFAVSEIDEDPSDKAIGWTSFQNPYQPDFGGSSFVYGNYLVFSLRIDKKIISPKVINKHYAREMAKRLEESGRDFLSQNEKRMIKDHVLNVLSLRIPATPNIYDIIWNYEESDLWFFTNLKAANEELETLFSQSLRLTLIRLFPYTMAELTSALSDSERDRLNNLSPSQFS